MKDQTNYPHPPKEIEWDQMLNVFFNMVKQISETAPDEIVAVNPQGFAFAAWVSQILKLPLGGYWPDREILVVKPESKKLIFVDDFLDEGKNLNIALEFMKDNEVDWAWAVVFSDCNDPEELRKMVIQGAIADYYIKEPFPGSMKVNESNSV